MKMLSIYMEAPIDSIGH